MPEECYMIQELQLKAKKKQEILKKLAETEKTRDEGEGKTKRRSRKSKSSKVNKNTTTQPQNNQQGRMSTEEEEPDYLDSDDDSDNFKHVDADSSHDFLEDTTPSNVMARLIKCEEYGKYGYTSEFFNIRPAKQKKV